MKTFALILISSFGFGASATINSINALGSSVELTYTISKDDGSTDIETTLFQTPPSPMDIQNLVQAAIPAPSLLLVPPQVAQAVSQDQALVGTTIQASANQAIVP